MYINTTSSSLILTNGAVSNSLLKAGGQRLQDECTAHVQQHGNVKEWSFATTGPGNLKCKHVIHTVGGSYNGAGGSAEKVGFLQTECSSMRSFPCFCTTPCHRASYFQYQDLLEMTLKNKSITIENYVKYDISNCS